MPRAGGDRSPVAPGSASRPHDRAPRRFACAAAAAVVAGLLLVGCGDAASPSEGAPTPAATTAPSTSGAPSASGSASAGQPGAGPSESPTRPAIRVQLQWFPQAQFAGYYAAVEQGYYDAADLDVTFVPGGPDVSPQVAGSLPNGSEFTISWVPKVLAAREGPVASDLVDIAQVFRRSGTLTVSWRDDGITSLADFEDKRVALWDRGNDLEVTAALTKAGLEAGPDYRRFDLGAGVEPFLARQVDVIQATVYNEYAQILEAANRRSGGPNLPTDLDTINYADEGTAMLQDAIFARASWLAEPGNEDLAIRFLRASFQGWIFCRDQPDDCVRYTLEAGVARGAGHQAWMLNEVNPLIWPSPDGIGIMDPDLWQATVDVALEAGIIRSAPAPGAYRTDLAEAALASLAERSDVDPIGESFQKGYVEITPDGE